MKKITCVFVLLLFCFTAANAQAWKQLRGGGKGKEIYNDKGTLWVIGIDNSIFSYNGRLWKEYPGRGKAIDIAVHDGTPYIIGLNNGIWKGTGSGWVPMPGNGLGKRIYSDNGQLWIIGINNNIFSFENRNWNLYSGAASAIDIAAYDGIPYIIAEDGSIWRGNGMGWIQLRGNGIGKKISCDRNGTVWILGVNNSVFSYRFGRWNPYPGGGKGLDIAVYRGVPYLIGLRNSIWKG